MEQLKIKKGLSSVALVNNNGPWEIVDSQIENSLVLVRFTVVRICSADKPWISWYLYSILVELATVFAIIRAGIAKLCNAISWQRSVIICFMSTTTCPSTESPGKGF